MYMCVLFCLCSLSFCACSTLCTWSFMYCTLVQLPSEAAQFFSSLSAFALCLAFPCLSEYTCTCTRLIIYILQHSHVQTKDEVTRSWRIPTCACTCSLFPWMVGCRMPCCMAHVVSHYTAYYMCSMPIYSTWIDQEPQCTTLRPRY